jgi:hypothetical protein
LGNSKKLRGIGTEMIKGKTEKLILGIFNKVLILEIFKSE